MDEPLEPFTDGACVSTLSFFVCGGGLFFLYYNTERCDHHLPRQARDKHVMTSDKKKTKKREFESVEKRMRFVHLCIKMRWLLFPETELGLLGEVGAEIDPSNIGANSSAETSASFPSLYFL
jgi:hypothetical protein